LLRVVADVTAQDFELSRRQTHENPLGLRTAYRVSLARSLALFLGEVAAARGLPKEGVPQLLTNSESTIPGDSTPMDYLHVVAKVDIQSLVRQVADSPDLTSTIAWCFESLYGVLPNGQGTNPFDLQQTHDRRDSGAYFTPPEIAEFLTAATLDALIDGRQPDTLRGVRVIDPSCGPGIFLVAALRHLSHELMASASMSELEARTFVATNCIYGVDLDPLTSSLAAALLWLEVGNPGLSADDIRPHIGSGDALLGSVSRSSGQNVDIQTHLLSDQDERRTGRFEWSLAFPEVFNAPAQGFDAVLSNPPWGSLRPTMREFVGYIDASISDLQGADSQSWILAQAERGIEELWHSYSHAAKEYRNSLKHSGTYRAQSLNVSGRSTSGDADYYKYFLERYHQLTKETARIGLVLPSAFCRTEGAAGVRDLYLRNGTFEVLFDFLNLKRIFPIHSMFRFLLTTYQRGPAHGIEQYAVGLTSIEKAKRLAKADTFPLDRAYLNLVGGELQTLLDVRSRSEKDLALKLHSKFPALGEAGGPWSVSFVREVDMTNDSHAFVTGAELTERGSEVLPDGVRSTRDGRRFLPVYEGRMVHQFDSMAKAYETGQARTATWLPLGVHEKRLRPHFYIDEADALRKNVQPTARPGFCDITGHANERSVLAALIPAGAVCGNKVPTCRFSSAAPEIGLLWLAIANSFVVDWLVRRRISTTLNFFHWKHVPFPKLDPNCEAAGKLIEKAKLLTEGGFPNVSILGEMSLVASYLEERAILRAEIDALVAKLFDLTPQDYVTILADFPLLDRHQPALTDDPRGGRGLRSTVTRDLALLEFYRLIGESPPTDLRNLLRVQDSHFDLTRRLSEARRLGAVAYVPSEMASRYSGSLALAAGEVSESQLHNP
jgi:hypothetical protein